MTDSLCLELRRDQAAIRGLQIPMKDPLAHVGHTSLHETAVARGTGRTVVILASWTEHGQGQVRESEVKITRLI